MCQDDVHQRTEPNVYVKLKRPIYASMHKVSFLIFQCRDYFQPAINRIQDRYCPLEIINMQNFMWPKLLTARIVCTAAYPFQPSPPPTSPVFTWRKAWIHSDSSYRYWNKMKVHWPLPLVERKQSYLIQFGIVNIWVSQLCRWANLEVFQAVGGNRILYCRESPRISVVFPYPPPPPSLSLSFFPRLPLFLKPSPMWYKPHYALGILHTCLPSYKRILIFNRYTCTYVA